MSNPMKLYAAGRPVLIILLIIMAVCMAGCGEEEKFNKEKAEILEELKQVQTIKVPGGLADDALDAAIAETSQKHKAALARVDA